MHRWKLVLGLLVLGLACAFAASAEPLRIRMSYVVPLSNWAPFMVAKRTSPDTGVAPTIFRPRAIAARRR